MADVGYLVVYLAWAVGLVAVGLAVRGWAGGNRRSHAWRRGRGRTPIVVVVEAALLVGSLALPWIAGPAAGTGERLVLTAWSGLDVLSVAGLVVLAAASAGHALRAPAPGTDDRLVGAALGGSALGLVAGNALIQLDQPGGSRLAWGAAVSLGAALLLLVTLLCLDGDDGSAPDA